jgi:hypothetical protein
VSNGNVIGDTPQPGETPRSEGDPWSFGDPDAAWWRGETERSDAQHRPSRHQSAAGGTGTLLPPSAPPRTGEAAAAHAAGTRDAGDELTPPAERDHDQSDPHRYDPLQPPSGYASKAAPVAADEPDVMILPEPTPTRPTVPLTVPEPPRQPLPPSTGVPATDARLAKLENSTFWLDHQASTVGPTAERPAHTVVRTHRGRRPARRLRLSAHVSLVALALASAFFGWVSAEPFWLATGHGDSGTATVITQRCTGQFTARNGRFTISRITLLGVPPALRAPGETAPAKMVSPDSRQVYLGGAGMLMHLRWVLGFALVLICGYAVAGVTGARRLETARARRAAVLLSLAGPVALLGGFLIAAY